MTFVNPGKAYNKDHVFTQAKLAPLTPVNIQRWTCQRATQATIDSLSLAYWKKAISFFMPNWLLSWNAVSAEGNPTRSIEVNDLIKKVKKEEV
jgi:hypothetical protein